jgi:glyoxylase-like metal-dependent hydrolase (beta-lactamase superfamily II)
LKDASEAQIYIHENDAPMLNDIEKSSAAMMPNMWKPCQADVLLKNGDAIEAGELKFIVMSTPGHSRGSVMYAVEGENVIFSGDTLFAGSVGRVDCWSGNHYEQMESLEKIKAIEGDFRILPGHGDETTLEHEKQTNPFLL